MGPSSGQPGARAGTSPRMCLTLDVELDYGRADGYAILERTAPFFDWLRGEQVPFTAFVTGQLLEQGHAILDSLQTAGVPIGVHGFSHRAETFGTMHADHRDEIRKGVDAYTKRFQQPPQGYRAPAGIVSRRDIELLAQLGLRYDASIFPLRRPGRYDFTNLPRTPFRWKNSSLVEMPFGLLTHSLPAGMSFINLFGAGPAAGLLRKQALLLGGAASIIDLHFHNLFTHWTSLRELPLALQLVYLVGAWRNGLTCLKSLVAKLRRAGVVFVNLETEALSLNPETLPVVEFDGVGDEGISR